MGSCERLTVTAQKDLLWWRLLLASLALFLPHWISAVIYRRGSATRWRMGLFFGPSWSGLDWEVELAREGKGLVDPLWLGS